ncbi:MAG TPA: hypothetical protein VLB74_09600 [Flavobacterium sp.]|uniref:hypothetical protein n=1 Tax=Flavobacterium sp. TaxID=239 RepID=UPI002C204BFE|nr:hypothetical protein [Flavobacterium sp.]HSD14889.1 hypothetical protein [Flavobacterium sp.]
MKKLIYAFSALALLFASCSSDSDSSSNDSSATVLLKKIIETDWDGAVTTSILTYNGDKLQRITNDDGTYEVYTYSGDLITKSESFDENDARYEAFVYTYNSESKLIEAKWLDYLGEGGGSSKVLYTHNSDGTVSYEEFTGDVSSQTEFYREGKIYSDKIEEYAPEFDGTPAHTITHTYTYDDKNQPMKNVKGYDKIWFAFTDYGTNYLNNMTSNLHTTTLGVNQPISSTVYTYNSQNYPITETETQQGSEHVIAVQYFYE